MLVVAAALAAALSLGGMLVGCGQPGSSASPSTGGEATGSASPGASAPGADPTADGEVPPLICGVASPPQAPASPSSGPPVTITDRTQVVWDVSTAVYTYGFDSDGFEYGLGLGAIAPVNDPQFLEPGDSDYPDADDDIDVIGLEVDGDARAYPVRAVSFREIVNDRVGDAYISVSY